jgi:SMI1-KNR4 cell-wall
MVVNGFELPQAFVQLVEATQQDEGPSAWELKEDVDAYGEPWENGGLELYTNSEYMAEETRALDRMYRQGKFQHLEGLSDEPGFIDDFTGVSHFVWFGSNAAGEVYCFDFGGDPKEPSVFYWEDGYWRRVAPNFKTFMELFVPEGERDRGMEEAALLPGEEGWAAPQPAPRVMLAQLTREYARRREGYRPFFEDLASYYAGCSPEERREVEAEVREKLEQIGMTDDQRRTHEELWARLRTTDRSN